MGVLSSELKGSLAPVGLSLQLPADCPCSFGSLGADIQNFSGGEGQLWGAPSTRCRLSLDLVFVLLVWGGGNAREMLSRSTQCD